MPVINLEALQNEAKVLQPDLKALPYAIMGDELAKMGIALKSVAGVDVVTVGERKGGLLKPYVPGTDITNSDEILRLQERELRVEAAYIAMKDNIKNYQTASILNNPNAVLGINETKEHPLQDKITANIVRTAAEDTLDALFHAKRNTADLSPLGAFDGFYKKIDDMIAAGEVATAKGNLINTGAIAAPTTDTDTQAIDQIVAFVRSADRMLRKGPAVLYMNTATYNAAIDALENKLKYKSSEQKTLQSYINEKASANIVVVVSDYLGEGSRIILSMPGNFEFGLNTMSAIDFVQVRNPYEDPFLVQFFLSFDAGTRILMFNRKAFATNDQQNTAIALSGDYETETTTTTT